MFYFIVVLRAGCIATSAVGDQLILNCAACR